LVSRPIPEEAITMAGFVGNLQELTRRNESFRRVLFTAPNSQLVVMCLRPREEIGLERHDHIDQLFEVVQGDGTAVLDGSPVAISEGAVVMVPAGVEHNIINATSDRTLLLATVYSPPAHRDLLVHQTRADAVADETDHAPEPLPLAVPAG
jgi:mannose-6-phosphate isomerase-like protein (cupin superfamily)